MDWLVSSFNKYVCSSKQFNQYDKNPKGGHGEKYQTHLSKLKDQINSSFYGDVVLPITYATRVRNSIYFLVFSPFCFLLHDPQLVNAGQGKLTKSCFKVSLKLPGFVEQHSFQLKWLKVCICQLCVKNRLGSPFNPGTLNAGCFFFTHVFVVLMGLLTVTMFQDTRAKQIYLELKITNTVCLGGPYNLHSSSNTYFCDACCLHQTLKWFKSPPRIRSTSLAQLEKMTFI